MRELKGHTALVTGASGGIGSAIARALAEQGMNLIVSGRRADALEQLSSELTGLAVKAEPLSSDLLALDRCQQLVEQAEQALGPLDVLINNAGVEYASAFTRMTAEELGETVNLNLLAPMLLTRAALPGMLERGRGHVVFIASVAGKFSPAYESAYGASKAGLVAFNQSLRSEYLDAPVSFSVICPGFVEGEGMYQRMVEQGIASNRLMGSTTLEKVSGQVVRAIRDDVPEIVVSGAPLRPVLALSQLAPRLVERMAPRIGATSIFRRAAAARGRAD